MLSSLCGQNPWGVSTASSPPKDPILENGAYMMKIDDKNCYTVNGVSKCEYPVSYEDGVIRQWNGKEYVCANYRCGDSHTTAADCKEPDAAFHLSKNTLYNSRCGRQIATKLSVISPTYEPSSGVMANGWFFLLTYNENHPAVGVDVVKGVLQGVETKSAPYWYLQDGVVTRFGVDGIQYYLTDVGGSVTKFTSPQLTTDKSKAGKWIIGKGLTPVMVNSRSDGLFIGVHSPAGDKTGSQIGAPFEYSLTINKEPTIWGVQVQPIFQIATKPTPLKPGFYRIYAEASGYVGIKNGKFTGSKEEVPARWLTSGTTWAYYNEDGTRSFLGALVLEPNKEPVIKMESEEEKAGKWYGGMWNGHFILTTEVNGALYGSYAIGTSKSGRMVIGAAPYIFFTAFTFEATKYTATVDNNESGTYSIRKGDQCLQSDTTLGACPTSASATPPLWKYDDESNTLQSIDTGKCLIQSETDCFQLDNVKMGDCASDDAKRFALTSDGGIQDIDCGVCYQAPVSGLSTLTPSFPDKCSLFEEEKKNTNISLKTVAIAVGILVILIVLVNRSRKKK